MRAAFANQYRQAIALVERARFMPSLWDLLGITEHQELQIATDAMTTMKQASQLGIAVSQKNYRVVDSLYREIQENRAHLESISRANSFYVWEQIRDGIPVWRDLGEQIRIYNAQKNQAAELEGLKTKYRDLKEKMKLIIVVPFDRGEDQMTFYSEGVLKDLPFIVGIPDAIESLAQLRNTLGVIGGRVRLPPMTEDPKGYFLKKLDEYRSEALAIQTDPLFVALGTPVKNPEDTERQFVTLTTELLQQIGLLVSKLIAVSVS